MKLQRLNNEELDIMLMVWQAGSAVTEAYLLEAMAEKRPLEQVGLARVLSRLVDKGFLRRLQAGRNGDYVCAVSRADYRHQERKNLLEKLFASQIKARIAASAKTAPERTEGGVFPEQSDPPVG